MILKKQESNLKIGRMVSCFLIVIHFLTPNPSSLSLPKLPVTSLYFLGNLRMLGV